MCSNEGKRSSAEEELPACSLNAPCQAHPSDPTVSPQLSVWLPLLPNVVKLMVPSLLSFPCKDLPLVWIRFPPQPFPASPPSFSHLKERRWEDGETETPGWTLPCPSFVTWKCSLTSLSLLSSVQWGKLDSPCSALGGESSYEKLQACCSCLATGTVIIGTKAIFILSLFPPFMEWQKIWFNGVIDSSFFHLLTWEKKNECG